MSKMCALLGHRRDKARARPFLDTWRSECARCKIPMIRGGPGSWTIASTLEVGPEHYAKAIWSSKPSAGKLQTVPDQSVASGIQQNDDPTLLAETSMRFRSEHQAPSSSKELYLSKSSECRNMAKAAKDRAVQLLHLGMATRYKMLARDTEDEDWRLQA